MAKPGNRKKFGPYRVGQWVEYDHFPGLFNVVKRTDRGIIVRGSGTDSYFKLQIRRNGEPGGALDIEVEGKNVRPTEQPKAAPPPASSSTSSSSPPRGAHTIVRRAFAAIRQAPANPTSGKLHDRVLANTFSGMLKAIRAKDWQSADEWAAEVLKRVRLSRPSLSL